MSDPEFMQCPLHQYRALLDSGQRVTEDPDLGVVAVGYDEILELVKRPKDFSNVHTARPQYMGLGGEPIQPDVQAVLDQVPELTNTLFDADPPEHTRHRKLMNKALNPRRVRQLEARVQQTVDELIDAFIEDGDSVDFLPAYGVMLPLTIISDILGVRHEDMTVFRDWGDKIFRGYNRVLTHEQRLENARALLDFHTYFEPLIEERRRRPREDLLSWMVNAEADGEPTLTNAEVRVMCALVLTAGHETTTNLIGNAAVILAQRPELQDRLRATPSDIPQFLEEVLRWDSPIQAVIRRTTHDLDFHGHASSEGQVIFGLWGAANRDATVFTDPDTFNIDRPNVRKHLGFGHGIHFCVGSELARMEGRLSFEAMLRRMHDIRLDEAQSDLSRHPSLGTSGYNKIVLRFTKA